MKIVATKSLSVSVPAGSTFVIGAPDSIFPDPDEQIINPFDPPRDSNIKICVDATSLAGNNNNILKLKVDVSGDSDFAIYSELTGRGESSLENVNCFDVAARDFQLIIISRETDPKDVEVAIIWNTGNKVIS